MWRKAGTRQAGADKAAPRILTEKASLAVVAANDMCCWLLVCYSCGACAMQGGGPCNCC